MVWIYGPGGNDPYAALRYIVEDIDQADDDDLVDLGVGPLESLLFENEGALWDEIERLARTNLKFRKALSCVWAYDSEKFEDRERLLHELGEFIEVQVGFVAYRESMDPNAPLSFRALSIRGLDADQLPPLLRDIADQIDTGQPGPADYPSDGVKLLVPTALVDLRPALEQAIADAGLVVVANEHWWERPDSPVFEAVTIKARHDPGPDGTPCIGLPAPLREAVLAAWHLVAHHPVPDRWPKLHLALLLPGDRANSFTLTGIDPSMVLNEEEARTALGAIDALLRDGRSGVEWMWLGGIWFDGEDM